MNIKITLPLVLSLFALGGCSDPTDYDFEGSVIDAAAAVPAPPIPFPNTALFAGSADGTLNIPLPAGVESDNFSHPQVALNTLDGFSTTQPLVASFDVTPGATLDTATVMMGDTVRMYEVTTTAEGVVTGVVAELTATVAATATSDSVVVIPLVPLKESTGYMMVVTNGVLDSAGRPPVNSVFRLVSGALPLTGETLGDLEGLRQLTNVMMDTAASQGVDRSSIVQAWTTRTQSITPVLNEVKNLSQAGGAITVAPANATTNDLNEALPGIADVYIGTLEVPYYLTVPGGPGDLAGVSSFWRSEDGGFLTANNAVPFAADDVTIPVLMSVPNAGSGQTAPAAGWPVVIFVHGITRDRTDMLAIADTMAQAGFAVIAIDQAMHGITDTTNALAADNTPFPDDVERSFGLDLVDNETGEDVSDGVPDTSGRHYYSPAQLLASRDNLRQSVADLLVLSASLGNVSAVPLDAARKAVVGHSLGGTAATIFAAMDDSLTSVSLGMPAAGLVDTTLDSEAFNGPILAGLAATGIVPNTDAFREFKVAAQTIVDSGDSINFATQAAAKYPIHVIEVIGDATVPNEIEDAPLAGTSALVRLMGLTLVTAEVDGSGVVRFTEGAHGSLLSPEASPAATAEMQTQLAIFAANGGTKIVVTDTSVIQTAE